MTAFSSRCCACLIAASVSWGWIPDAAAFEPDYESLHVTTRVPARLIEGRDYRIASEVVNRGLMNHYRIETSFGPMRAHSDLQLAQRLKEIEGLRRLTAMNEGVVVAESVGRTIWQTTKSMVRVATNPRATAQGLNQGVQRLLRRSGRRLQNAYRDVRDRITGKNTGARQEDELSDKALEAGTRFARNRLGVSRAYRDLAREVGVDPYTDNVMLVNELDQLARHTAGASLGTRIVMPRIPGIIGAVDEASKLVWNKDRLDLLLHNEDALERLSVPDAVIRAFIDNESYSPTQQTAMVTAATPMKGTRNLWRLFEHAAEAGGPSEAEFYASMAALLSVYHRNRSALVNIQSTGSFLPVAFTRDHRVVAVFPVDRFRWTREVATVAAALNASSAGGIRHRELWVTGRISTAAGSALSRHGWIPFNHAYQRLGTTLTSVDRVR